MKKDLLRFVVALMMTAFIATGCQKKPRVVADQQVTTPEANAAEKSQAPVTSQSDSDEDQTCDE